MTTIALQEVNPKDPGKVDADVFFKTLPTTTVHQARLQLYQPTRRPTWQERVIATPWGTAKVRGKIGQVHADIIEAICRHAEDYRYIPGTGHLQLLVDPYKVRVSVGGGAAYSKDTLWRMVTELRETSITLEAPSQGLKVLGGILDRVDESLATKPHPVTGKPRRLWRVTLGHSYITMLGGEQLLYDKQTSLAKIETGVAQAIARYCLSCGPTAGSWDLDTLIHLVGAGAGGRSETMRNRRRDVLNSVKSLREVGVFIEGDRVICRGSARAPVTTKTKEFGHDW